MEESLFWAACVNPQVNPPEEVVVAQEVVVSPLEDSQDPSIREETRESVLGEVSPLSLREQQGAVLKPMD